MDDYQGLLNTLQKYWRYDTFRSLQAEIMLSVLQGKDTLALLPTGGGKSICFQVPALYKEGICIVVSPLIALMKDQVANLKKRNISAVAIYSGMAYHEIDRILDNCVYGGVKLLYLSPERLKTEIVIERIKRMNVNLLAIDEAHCISQWGYDFRPAYLNISEIRAYLPDVPVLALTATATPKVVRDIQEKLLFKKTYVLQKSFQRDNLAYVVFEEEDKLRRMKEILLKVLGSGIVYVQSRKRTQEIAKYLVKAGISASYYHAGMSTEQRTKVQDAWVDNRLRVIVATNAFGMGIDKPDVRIVLHLSLPNSLEAYFQEAGRAGRDEEKAYAVLLKTREDEERLYSQYERTFPTMDTIRLVYKALIAYYQLAIGSGQFQTFDFDLAEFSAIYKLPPLATYNVLKVLEQSNWLMLTESVYTPASLRFVVNKEELYDYQLRNRKMDLVIKRILQNYQGAFNNYVSIFEGRLAQILKTDVGQVKKALKLLAQHAIIDYRPSSEKPQIVFLEEIVDVQNLTIDQKQYTFRKQMYKEKLDGIIRYVQRPVCRNIQLLDYFGEVAKPCGTCDVCLGRTKTKLSDAAYNDYHKEIESFLLEEEQPLYSLLERFPLTKRDEVFIALSFLENEGYLNHENGVLKWIK